ncbi:hypothetical protein EYF80_056571 [Liparis tanakae]|uniref:Uncharacterized protein n=1 Tax=Liparis tanakae TaxID=230148 RepID=A0A4Z2EWW2_9TELE|nr:hypothetical protein EYF80_056571 [Liparis tanakae]
MADDEEVRGGPGKKNELPPHCLSGYVSREKERERERETLPCRWSTLEEEEGPLYEAPARRGGDYTARSGSSPPLSAATRPSGALPSARRDPAFLIIDPCEPSARRRSLETHPARTGAARGIHPTPDRSPACSRHY